MNEFEEEYFKDRKFEDKHFPWNKGMKPWEWMGNEKWKEVNIKQSEFMKKWHKTHIHPMKGRKHPNYEPCRKALHKPKTDMWLSKIYTKWKKGKKTDIELKIQKELELLHIEFENNFAISGYVCDFAILDKKVIIECDGDYWHSIPNIIEHDKKKDENLTSLGWKVIRLKGSDIHKNIHRCIEIVKQYL